MTSTSEDGFDKGNALATLLRLHRDFVERGYSLLSYIQEDLEKNWSHRAVQYGGAARNGNGSGFRSSPEWVQSYLGLAFVAKSIPTTKKQGAVATPIPPDGLEVLLFQIRWLEKMEDGPPVVWGARSRAHLDLGQSADFEPYYFSIFSKLEESKEEGLVPRRLEDRIAKPGRYPALHVSGTLHEVPLAGLEDKKAVQNLLIRPLLSMDSV